MFWSYYQSTTNWALWEIQNWSSIWNSHASSHFGGGYWPNLNLPFGNRTILCLIPCYHASKKSDEWNSFSERILAVGEWYNSYFEAYADGSKCEQKVAAATFYPIYPDDPGTTWLRGGSSVFNAYLEGILLALKKFLTLTKTNKKFIIYTDSLSAFESLQGETFWTKNIKRFYNLLKKLPPQIQIIIAWIPLHVGITGNERADRYTPIGYTFFFFNFYSFLNKNKNDPSGTPLYWSNGMIELVSVQKDS